MAPAWGPWRTLYPPVLGPSLYLSAFSPTLRGSRHEVTLAFPCLPAPRALAPIGGVDWSLEDCPSARQRLPTRNMLV